MPRKKIEGYIIDLNCCLGEGSFGEVYKGVCDKTKAEVAIKVISKKKLRNEDTFKETYITEIIIMRKLKSENIVQLIDVLETHNHYYVVQEFCNGGDLRKKMDQCSNFRQEEVVLYLKDILSAFMTLIDNGIIHRDIKPENILLNNNKMKVADFGFSKMIFWQTQFNVTLVGTPLYMSPQLLMSEKYTSKCDIWALGVITYELLFGRLPWMGESEMDLIKNIIKNPLRFQDHPKVGSQLKEFIAGCLKVEEHERYSWKEVYEHQIFQGRFKDFIVKFDQEERKFKEVINNLRLLIHISDVDLETIFNDLKLTPASMLSRDIFSKILKRIDPEDTLVEDFDLVIKKLDDDSDNLVSLQSFKQLLKASSIKTMNLVKETGSHEIDHKQQLNQKMVRATTQKLSEKMCHTGISMQQLFVSYTKSKTLAINCQKFEKLFLKVDPRLTQKEILFLFGCFDTNKNGLITFDEFQSSLEVFSN